MSCRYSRIEKQVSVLISANRVAEAELNLFSGIVFVYVLGVVGYIYAMRNWTLDTDSLYWQDHLKRY